MKLLILPTRLVRPALTVASFTNARIPITNSLKQQRHASNKADPDQKSLHPILAEYYKNRPSELEKVITGSPERDVKFGEMPVDTIFGEDEATDIIKKDKIPEPQRPSSIEQHDPRSLDVLNNVLDPLPFKRWRWERQRVIKDARRGWRLSKGQYIERTERKCAENSTWLKTSTKKLSLLARQIAGKSIDGALLQLRFSKKRPAAEVAKHLEHTRNMAIVKWGMGLGEAEDRKGEPATIRLKGGKKHVITDRTALYIEQAMVQRGKYEVQVEHRARGRSNLLKKPFTALRVVLKEEHTRIREYEERQAKTLRKKPFIPLPDKPITQQRQYILW